MAKAIHPDWPAPAPSKAKGTYEPTFDEWLDEMAARQQSMDFEKERGAKFSSYFDALLAKPGEEKRAQEEEYEKDRIRSTWINAQEKLRQEQEPLMERAREYASQEFRPSSQNPGAGPALRQYIEGGQRGPSPGMTIDDYRDMKQEYIKMLDRDPAHREHWNAEIDQVTEDIRWLERPEQEKQQLKNRDLEHYNKILWDAAKAGGRGTLSEVDREFWRNFYYGSSSADDI